MRRSMNRRVPVRRGPRAWIEPKWHDGVPEGTRTPDPKFRKLVLYPAELPGQKRQSPPN